MYKYETLPVVLFFEISESENLNLLNPNNNEISIDELVELWNEIREKFIEKDNNQLSKRVFRLNIDIEYLNMKYILIQLCVNQLRFEINEEALNILKDFNYHINTENTQKYYADLERTETESKGILNRIGIIKNQLPKQKEENNNPDNTIHDILASFCTVLGFNIGDFNKITCSEYHSFKKQVDNKVKAQEKQIQELKAKKNG